MFIEVLMNKICLILALNYFTRQKDANIEKC